MTSSNDNEHKLNEVKADLRTLLDELHLRLGATEAIMDNYLGKTEGDFVKMAASGTVSAPEDIVSKLDDHNRQIVLKQMIFCFRPLKKILKILDPEMPTKALENLVDELWEIERGGRNWLLKRPKGLGRGNRPSVSTSIHRASLVVAYDKLIEDGESADDAIASLSEETQIKRSTIEATIKDFHELQKDAASIELYRELTKAGREADDYIKLYKDIITSQRG